MSFEGYKEKLFVALESSYGAGATHTSDDFVPHLSALTKMTRERLERADRLATRAKVLTHAVGRLSAEWNYEGYLYLAGTNGSAPIMDNLLRLAFQKSVSQSATVQATPSPTPQQFAILPTDACSAGDWIVVNGEIRPVMSNDSGTITLLFPLSEAPSEGDTVYPAVSYRPTDNPNASAALLRALGDDYAEYMAGAVLNEWSFELSPTEICRFTCNGLARQLAHAGQDALEADITDADTILSVSDAYRFSVGSYIQIDDEVMLITDIDTDANTLTVARGQLGTSATAHSAGATIKPYVPSILPASDYPSVLVWNLGSGYVSLAGQQPYSLELVSLTINGTENVALVNDTAAIDRASRAAWPQRREITASVELYMSQDAVSLLGAIRDSAVLSIFAQVGEDLGQIFGIVLGGQVVEDPAVETAADELTKLSFELKALDIMQLGLGEVWFAFG